MSEDEPLSGLNGRLRPRRSTVTSPHVNKALRKNEPKTSLERQKRTSTPSKASSTKPDDLANKSDTANTPQLLCPYCDRKFASKQTVSKHARRVHLSNPKHDSTIACLFCNHVESEPNDIIRHMVNSHPNQYFACLECHTRFSATSDLAEHKLNVCEKQKLPYRSKLRQKAPFGAKKSLKALKVDDKLFRSEGKDFPEGPRFNGVVISCELKPSQISDEADIEDNITTNLILPPSKNLGGNSAIEKNAVIVLDDIQWNKRMPTNFSFHNTDADQILSRLGVVHRSPRTAESTKKDWLKNAEEATQKFEKCFDTGFYSKVASNVHENLSKFLDGSFNFNPDPDSVIKTRKSKNSVVINAAEGFPILLAYEQYSRNVFDEFMPRTLAPRHKWKWGNERALLNPDDIKHDTHVNNCIITLVSSLDIWTQLCMRRKFEKKFSIAPLEKKTEKQNAVSNELKQILESRELPSTSQQVVKYVNKPSPLEDNLDFPASLGLTPSPPSFDLQPAVLSGEWVRPRCYVCCACGAQTRDSRGLSSHISAQHPNAQVQHYEIVGELLLNADILKHLYVPPSQMSNRTRPLRGFRECTKCKKSVSLEDFHQHMLDCAGDAPAVRRKCRYRPFGVRRRRSRLPDNTIRKKIRKDIRSRQTRQKTHMRQRPKIRSEVGDAETIRKMLADLPAKRHRVMVNPMNSILRPRRKIDKQRNTIIMKRRSSEILKNRKRELRRNTMNRGGSNNLDNDDNDAKNPNKSDDENQPLKPRGKPLKLTHRTRQSESLKRKVAMNRAKRRAQIKEQKAFEEKLEAPTDTFGAGSSKQANSRGCQASSRGGQVSSKGSQVDQQSNDNSPERVDVSTGPYNTREQASRGRGRSSNNRDDQIPGPSRQDGHTNNHYSPPEQRPLRHSTSQIPNEDKDNKQDQAVPYNHHYLMPPESSEVPEHVHTPTGQQRQFENEEGVTKLDKPPLHSSTDPDPSQKGKNLIASNNKRKGLNDCIAMLMLKNNCVIPSVPTSDALEVPPDNNERADSELGSVSQRSPTLDCPMNMHHDPNAIPPDSGSPGGGSPGGDSTGGGSTNGDSTNGGSPGGGSPDGGSPGGIPPGGNPPGGIPPGGIPPGGIPPGGIPPGGIPPGGIPPGGIPPGGIPIGGLPPGMFYRHPFIQDRYLDYRPENNLLNFADQRYHFPIPGDPRNLIPQKAYDMPMPHDARLDPRFAHPTPKKKPNEGTQRTTRARNSRAEKEMRERELLLQASMMHYQMNIPPPARMTSAQARRASTHSVAESASALINQRRSSGSYNQPSPHFNEYRPEAMNMVPPIRLDYHPLQQLSPEAQQLIEYQQREVYLKAKQSIQNACAEQYTQQQMALRVDTDYMNKIATALSPEANNLRNQNNNQTTSPGSNYVNKKQAAVGSDGTFTSRHKQAVSPVDAIATKKHVSNDNENDYYSKNPRASKAEIAYNHQRDSYVSHENDLSGKVPATPYYVEGTYKNKKAQAVAAENKSMTKSHTVVSHESLNNKTVSPRAENSYIRPHAVTHTESNFANTLVQSVSDVNFVNKSVPTESNVTPKTSPVQVREGQFITKKQAAVSESNNKKQLALTEKHKKVAENTVNKDKQSDNVFVSKKQAAVSDNNSAKQFATALESRMANTDIKTFPAVSESGVANKDTEKFATASKSGGVSKGTKKYAAVSESVVANKEASTTDSIYVKNAQSIKADRNYYNKKMSNVRAEIYPESAFNNLPNNIPPTYTSIGTNFGTIPNEIETPLDLSKSTCNQIKEISMKKDTTRISDNFEKYETYNEISRNNNMVESRRTQLYSPTIPRLDMSSELSSADDRDFNKLMERQAPDALKHYMLKNSSNNNSYEYDPRNNEFEQELLQNIHKPHHIDRGYPADMSGRFRDASLSTTNTNNFVQPVEHLKSVDISVEKQSKDNYLSSVTTEQDSLKITARDKEKNKPRRRESASVGDSCTPVTKSFIDTGAQQTLYSLPISLTTTSVDTTIVTGKIRTSDIDESGNVIFKKNLMANTVYGTPSAVSTSVTGGSIIPGAISCVTSPIPLFTQSNTVAKYEITKPVYTLANACISMAKVEDSSVASASNNLSVPNTTIANAVNAATQYGPVHNISSHDGFFTNANTTCNTDITTNSNMSRYDTMVPTTKDSDEKQSKEKTAGISDLDPETAKKIAMLPKELVEILGTMPVDHRNQLLNVLPQYVSTSAAPKNDQLNKPGASNVSVVNRGVSPPRMSDFDVKPPIRYSPVSSSQLTHHLSLAQPIPSGSHYQPSDKSVHPDAEDSKYEDPLPDLSEVDAFIDLTEEDPRKSEIKRVIEEQNNCEIIPTNNEPVIIASSSKENKQKANDQTAILRAFRIKTALERNKLLSIDINTGSNTSGIEQQIILNVQCKPDLDADFDILSDLDKTLAIQQAEISSTQHNTIAGRCKYPPAISPSSTEYSGDESNKNLTRPSPILVTEVVAKDVEAPTPKRGKVTSSISKNAIVSPNVENNLQNIVDAGTQASPKSCDIENNDSILISKSTESDKLSCEVIDLEVTIKHNETSIRPKEPKDEDDSEDDISLAAMIKRKQSDQEKLGDMCEVIAQNIKTTQRSHKKKNKQKKIQKSCKKFAKNESLNDVSLSIPQAKDVNVVQSDSSNMNKVDATTNEEELNQSLLKRVKRTPRSISTSDTVNIQTETVQTIENDQDINKENNMASTLINNNKTTAQNYVPVDIKAHTIKESSPCSLDVADHEDAEGVKINSKLTVNQETLTDKTAIVTAINLGDTTANNTSKKQSKAKSKKLEFYEPDDIPQIHKDDVDQTVKDTLESSKIDQDVTLTSVTIDELQSTSDHDINSAVTNKEKKHSRAKKQRHEDVENLVHEGNFSQIVSNDLDIKESTETLAPLRRSRRGKSLYLESTLMETELCELALESKTPLTKKQLIFSKLRQDDEGTPKPSAHSTPETQNNCEIESGDLVTEQTVDTPKLSNIDNLFETFEERPKGTKRKISTQLMKKSKKKKSIEESDKLKEANNTENLENVDHSAEYPISIKIDFDKEKLESFNDVNEVSIKESNKVTPAVDSPVLSDYQTNSDKNSEKRKISSQISFDLSQSSEPKKCKMSKVNKKLDVDMDNDDPAANVQEITQVPETKTACYNVPVRRARSKSVIVKSASSELYDPYDIDLEDMAEQNESTKRKQNTPKNGKKKSANSGLGENKVKKGGRKNNQTFDVQPENRNDNEIGDSDDSSKSDVPLQKYVKEKRDKQPETLKENNIQTPKNDLKENEENKDVQSTLPSVKTNDVTQTEAEQELRSEQFMQSFGFFSEKKPRKSNLLASKKISETINITNESDDMYFGFKERSTKRNSHTDARKSSEGDLSKTHQTSTSKKVTKRGRKKKPCTRPTIMPKSMTCKMCKKEFQRCDNYLRHMLCLYHISKLSLAEMNIMIPLAEESDYILAFKVHYEGFLTLNYSMDSLQKKNEKEAADIPLPTWEGIRDEVNKTIAAIKARKEACKEDEDELMFLQFCILLRDAHRGQGSPLEVYENSLEIEEAKLLLASDNFDIDSATAKNILESEEVRKLENDLTSAFKEDTSGTMGPKIIQDEVCDFTMVQDVIPNEVVQFNPELQDQMVHTEQTQPAQELIDTREDQEDMNELHAPGFKDTEEKLSSPINSDCHYNNIEEFEVPAKTKTTKVKKYIEIKEKMYPDIIEDIDMFEDKFDKIKRKCRSQAAAAKQPQPVIEPVTSFKGRKKPEKKKGRRSSKKARYQNTQVPTKGALKGFDGIKVSIPTSDINMSGIVPVSESSPKRKKKSGSKKRRDKKDSESSSKYDSDHRAKDNTSHNKKVDVYEFMDNEDAELFEFRPSTLMERFKSISNNNKDTPVVTKFNTVVDDDNSSESGSDGDDFVYMSDDYVCSDDETENSLMSCEMSNVKIGTDVKKISPQKRKDVVEKNAVMGKIFKHAVRTEKKPVAIKEPAKPKANLDQLFDSLLEEEPSSSMLNSDALSPKGEEPSTSKYGHLSKYDTSPENPYTLTDDNFVSPQGSCSSSPNKTDMMSSATLSKRRTSSPLKEHISKKLDMSDINLSPSTSKKYDDSVINYGPSTSKKYDNPSPNDYEELSPTSYESESSKRYDERVKRHETKNKKRNDTSASKHEDDYKAYADVSISPASKLDEGISTSYDYSAEQDIDEAGVARPRRKCTVGKQNVLYEFWSSESEPDGGPPRPSSADSVMVAKEGRKKRGKKNPPSSRRGSGRQGAAKRQEGGRAAGAREREEHAGSGDEDPGEGPSEAAGPAAGVGRAGRAGRPQRAGRLGRVGGAAARARRLVLGAGRRRARPYAAARLDCRRQPQEAGHDAGARQGTEAQQRRQTPFGRVTLYFFKLYPVNILYIALFRPEFTDRLLKLKHYLSVNSS
ncbi:uncharacterized protein LOC114357404 isoform X2 [Ostrinia furnacalis]|nr:uncharacterized protein LOC114357404 isoform X2 [Ostrinia furnacalis]